MASIMVLAVLALLLGDVLKLTAIIAISIAGYVAVSHPLKPTCADLPSILAKQMMEPYCFPGIDKTVNRTDLFTRLHTSVSSFPVTLVFGQGQSGKSTLVDTYLNGRKNVYKYVPVPAAKVGADEASLCGEHALSTAVAAKVLQLATKETGQPAYAVAELLHDATPDFATDVYETLKTLMVDKSPPNVRGILVFSGDFSEDDLPRDSDAYDIVWVGDMKENEAEDFLHTRTRMDPLAVVESTGYHVSQLDKCVRLGSIKAWQDGVRDEVITALQMHSARNFMDVLPKDGANFSMLKASSPPIAGTLTEMLNDLQKQVHPIVRYNAALFWFHWASPFHYEVFQSQKVPQLEL